MRDFIELIKIHKLNVTKEEPMGEIMIVEVLNIIAGLILAMGILPSIPAVGKSLEKIAKWLGRFQTIIGVIAIIVGILYFGMQGIVAIVAGLILAMGILTSIPAIGNSLEKIAKWLGRFQTIIGIIAIIIGVWGLL
ncbi:MAG: hypothetical protein ABIH76_04280 [Candidatus Bathyarchaeota archaeon]